MIFLTSALDVDRLSRRRSEPDWPICGGGLGVRRFVVSDVFKIRFATAADLDVISWHRARMFRDMDELPAEMFNSFRAQSLEALGQVFAEGKYIGWLASPESELNKIVAGAGVALREVVPHPQPRANGKIDIVGGRQAIIQNVYTEPEWRRRGLAALLIKRIIDWTREQGIDSLVLHASDEGRAVYERLGFIATTEMRFRS
jgi:GNAT superfamily N-acetyltransferase